MNLRREFAILATVLVLVCIAATVLLHNLTQAVTELATPENAAKVRMLLDQKDSAYRHALDSMRKANVRAPENQP